MAVKLQGHCHCAGYLRNLKHMGQAGAVMIPCRSQKNLGFIFKTPECFAMDNPIPVPLEGHPYITLRFWPQSSPAFLAETGIRRKDLLLVCLHLFPNCSTHT